MFGIFRITISVGADIIRPLREGNTLPYEQGYTGQPNRPYEECCAVSRNHRRGRCPHRPVVVILLFAPHIIKTGHPERFSQWRARWAMKPLREEEKTRRIGHGSVIADYVFDRMRSGVELLDEGAKRIHPKASDEERRDLQ